MEEAPGLSKPGVSSTSEVPRVTSAHAMADQRLHGRDHTGVVAGAIAFGLVAVITIGVSKITSTNTDVKSSTPSTTSKLLTNSASSVGVGSASSVGQDSAPTTLAQPKNINVSPTVAKGITNVTQASSVSSSTTTTVRALIGVPNSANAQITVRVANGTSIPGAAGRITSELQNLDFNVVVPVNATVSNLSTTTVYYYAGFSVAGEAIARILGLPSTAAKLLTGTTPLPSIYPSDVNVVLGTDVAG